MAALPETDAGGVTLRDNLERVGDVIGMAAGRAGRDERDIKLVAVSKRQPWARVDAARRAGQLRFGENTLQDAMTKVARPDGSGLEWHFIGHVQSNKAAHVATQFAWVHSLDSVQLAHRLARAAAACGRPLNVLLQVNVMRERTKSGVLPEHLPVLLDQLQSAELPYLHLRGLMTVAARGASASALQRAFAELRQWRDRVAGSHGLARFTELSMGMSDDYVPAILEGATFVRLGTAVFGERSLAR